MNRTPLFVAAIVAACVYPQLAAADAPDACKVAGAGDVGKALGVPVTSTTARSAGSCNYRTSAFKSLTLTVVPQSSPAEAKTQYHEMVTSKLNLRRAVGRRTGAGRRGASLGAEHLRAQEQHDLRLHDDRQRRQRCRCAAHHRACEGQHRARALNRRSRVNQV